MWQRYSGNFTPPSLQTLEEGKQLLQNRFASFFDDACTHSACQYPESEHPESPMREYSDPHVVTPESNSGKNTYSDKATANTESFLSGDQQRNARLDEEGPPPPPPLEQFREVSMQDELVFHSPPTRLLSLKLAFQPIRIMKTLRSTSGNEVKVIEPSPSAAAAASSAADSKTNKKAPLELLEVRSEDAYELERSISELTMRSSYGGGESLANIPDNRRMAYYAVGKNHRQSGRGGNRRCYFSGKLILGGAPFYAGAVQQGLRTLVVFCLPFCSEPSRSKNHSSTQWNYTRSKKFQGLIAGG